MPVVDLSVQRKSSHFIHAISKAFLLNLYSLLTEEAKPNKSCKRRPRSQAWGSVAGPLILLLGETPSCTGSRCCPHRVL